MKTAVRHNSRVWRVEAAAINAAERRWESTDVALPRQDLLRHRFFVGVALNNLVMEAIERQLQAVGNAQLVVDLAQVILDHLFGGAQLERDLLVALALG